MWTEKFEIDKFNQYNLVEGKKQSTCPLCSHMRKKKKGLCAVLNWEKGFGTCMHCGKTFQLHTYKRITDTKPKYIKPTQKMMNAQYSEKLMTWFKSRGITKDTLQKMKVTEGPEWMPNVGKTANTVQFNFYRSGQLINTKYRDGRKNFKLVKGAERIFYNIDAIEKTDEVIIVEGEIDALSIIECGIEHVISVPNGSTTMHPNLEYLDTSIHLFENKKRIILALDSDEAGRNTQAEFIRRLGAHRCFTVDFSIMTYVNENNEIIKCKDANDILKQFGKAALIGLINSAEEIPLEGVTSVSEWRKEFCQYLVNGMKRGYTTNISSLDNIFSTYSGQYIVVTGRPSSGKSDFVDEMILRYSLKYGWKIGIASPENMPYTIHSGKLLAKLCGKWVKDRDSQHEKWFGNALDWLDNRIKYIDPQEGAFSLEYVLEKGAQMVQKFGIKVLVIDPFNKIRLKGSLNKDTVAYTSDYLCAIDEFCRKHDVIVFLVAHPRKPSGLDVKNYEPTFYDIKGASEFFDMSPHGLLVHRDYANDLVKVKVLKVKFAHLGINEAETYFRWNKSNGRFSEFREQITNPNLAGDCIIDNSNYFVEAAENDRNEQSIQVQSNEEQGLSIEENVPF